MSSPFKWGWRACRFLEKPLAPDFFQQTQEPTISSSLLHLALKSQAYDLTTKHSHLGMDHDSLTRINAVPNGEEGFITTIDHHQSHLNIIEQSESPSSNSKSMHIKVSLHPSPGDQPSPATTTGHRIIFTPNGPTGRYPWCHVPGWSARSSGAADGHGTMAVLRNGIRGAAGTRCPTAEAPHRCDANPAEAAMVMVGGD